MFEKLLVKIAQALNKNNIPYMVVGAQAVMIHGEPRFTGDIDITLGVDTDKTKDILKIIRELGLEPAEYMTEDFIKRNALLTVEDKDHRIEVDFIFSFMPYERQAIERAVKISLEDTDVHFACAEDTIIHKLFAGRPRDIEDVKGIIVQQKKLDKKYLHRWLGEFSEIAGRKLIEEYNSLDAEVNK